MTNLRKILHALHDFIIYSRSPDRERAWVCFVLAIQCLNQERAGGRAVTGARAMWHCACLELAALVKLGQDEKFVGRLPRPGATH